MSSERFTSGRRLIPTGSREELKKSADNINLNAESKSVDEKWNEFEHGVHRIMDAHIPHKMSSSRYKLPWFNRSLRLQSRAKHRLYNKAKLSGNPPHTGISSVPQGNACTKA